MLLPSIRWIGATFITALLTWLPLAAADETASGDAGKPREQLELLSAMKIWDRAPHSAFTDLIRFQGVWVCGFREADGHHAGAAASSRLRILTSDDASHWQSVAALDDERGDVRDVKFGIRPDGSLMLLTAVHLTDHPSQKHQSVVWFTRDLKTWEGPFDVGEPDIWLWGITWRDGTGYSIGYRTVEPYFARLYRTNDALRFEPFVNDLQIPCRLPNESAIVFDQDETGYALLRGHPGGAWIGTARPPYTDWSWKQSEHKIGGPALTLTPQGRLLGAGRLYKAEQCTSLLWIDASRGRVTEALALPSGGNDTSYPGLVWDDNVLHVSYYSSHEGKASIYLARVRVPSAEE